MDKFKTKNSKINLPVNTKTRENSIKKQIMTDNTTLNEQITQTRLSKQQNKAQKQLTNKVNEIDNKVSKLSDTSDTFAQDNKTVEKSQENVLSNHLKQYNSEDIARFSTNKSNLINNVNGKLSEFVKKFYDPNTKKAKSKLAPIKTQKMFLGRISDGLAKQINTMLNNSKIIQEKLGKKYDVKNTNFVISSNNIEHIYNHHGDEKIIGQIDVTPDNLSKYDEVVSNPDYIGVSNKLSRGNTPTLFFTKKINGYSVAVEVLSSSKQMYPETYYVFKSNSKEYADFIKNNKLKKAWDVESDDKVSSDIDVLDDTSAAFSINDTTTKDQKSQIAPVSLNNMQQEAKNDT